VQPIRQHRTRHTGARDQHTRPLNRHAASPDLTIQPSSTTSLRTGVSQPIETSVQPLNQHRHLAAAARRAPSRSAFGMQGLLWGAVAVEDPAYRFWDGRVNCSRPATPATRRHTAPQPAETPKLEPNKPVSLGPLKVDTATHGPVFMGFPERSGAAAAGDLRRTVRAVNCRTLPDRREWAAGVEARIGRSLRPADGGRRGRGSRRREFRQGPQAGSACGGCMWP
jgi:hypothetical protein